MFGIYLLPNYGEGVEYAFKRFHREIDASLRDRLRQQAAHPALEAHSDTAGGTMENTQGAWLVPFQRPKSFVGRDRQLAQVRAHIASEDGQRLAIYGLGGCGKTALALESLYWAKVQQPTRAIFWVPAISRESFEQAYHEIGKLLSIPGIDDNKSDIMRLVAARLSDEEIGPWLMVVDNADDESILFGGVKEVNIPNQLIDYLPQSRKGSIIFTTRTRAAAVRLAESNLLSLVDLEKEEASELLGRRLTQQNQKQLKDVDTVDKFLDLLSCHALAIVQATAFIDKNDITLSSYIALYESSERDAIDLLGEEFEDQTRYKMVTNAVATTWYISFQQIQAQHPIAAEHLFFMACTASDDIDPCVFPPEYTKTEHIKAIGTLKAYAFITNRVRQMQKSWGKAQYLETIDVHPLVHLAISGWLKAHGQWDLWLETVLKRFIKIVPYGDHSTKDYWAAYMHHAMHVTNLPEVQKLEGRMTLLERIATCESALGHFRVAERVYRQAHDQRLRTLGGEHPDTLKTMSYIALMLGYQGRWVDAEKMHAESLRLATKALGDKHPQTLRSKSNLALTLHGLWKWKEAESMYRELLKTEQEVVGPEDLQTLTTMQNLGATLCEQGKHAEAEETFRKTYNARKAHLGVDHVDTLSSLSVLGTALHYQAKYPEAEALHRQDVALRTRVLGHDHPNTMKSMHKLSLTLSEQEKHAEAEVLLQQVLRLTAIAHGPEAPATLHCKSAVAQSLRAQARNAEAETAHRECLVLMEKVLGIEHRMTLVTVFSLAEIARVGERYKEAQGLYQRAFDGFKSVLGEDHQRTKECGEQVEWMGWFVDGQKSRAERERGEGGVDAGSLELEQEQEQEVVLRPKSRWRERVRNMVKKTS